MGKFDISLASRSLLGPNKLDFLESTAQEIQDLGVPGKIAEAGVYQGGSAKLLATVFPDREILLFDSFQGMLEDDADSNGKHYRGDFADNSLEQVKSYLRDHQNCRFYPGWFPATAKFLSQERFALVHADMDLYQSTRDCIQVFWPRITVGGVMIFDDYEWHKCPGVKKALDEFFTHRNDFKTQRRSGLHSIAYYKIPG